MANIITELEKDQNITYLKAIGIILMVICHAGCPDLLTDFVYMFHMPLFFFVSGYCFKQKYLNSPILYLKRKVKSIYYPFVKWSLLFMLLHNLFFVLNIYNGHYGYNGNVSKMYDFEDCLHQTCAIITMSGGEELLGGYWFLRVLFFSSIFAWIALRINKRINVGGGSY